VHLAFGDLASGVQNAPRYISSKRTGRAASKPIALVPPVANEAVQPAASPDTATTSVAQSSTTATPASAEAGPQDSGSPDNGSSNTGNSSAAPSTQDTASPPNDPAQGQPSSGDGDVIPDEYIVVLKQSANKGDVLRTHGLNPHHHYSKALNGFATRIPPGQLRAVINDARVAIVEPDVKVSALGQVIPTGVQRIGATRCPVAKIDGIDDRVNADVAIIDTGIDLTHPDLNVYQNVTFVTNTTNGNDDNGHGTHVAGIVGALDNSIGVVGVAPGARLWAVKVLDSTGSGALSTIISGVDYVTQHASQIEVANMSLGGQGSSDSLRLAIQNSVAAGVVYVVAAGNSGFDIYGGDATFGTSDDFFPASYPEVMTVSALVDTDGQPGGTGVSTSYGADDTLATFSNWSNEVVSSNPVNSPGAAIDVAAPGVNIYSTYKGGTYATMSGTSMASPHVAGAVALYVAAYGRAYSASGVYAIRQALINSADPQTSWGVNKTTPYSNDTKPEGLIDVAGIGSTTTSSNTPPTVSISSPTPNSSFDSASPITFSGAASDQKDGNLTSSIIWSSSINGQIGTGGTISATLSVGTHTITAKVTDSSGSIGVAAVTVIVTSSTDVPPTIAITSPANGANFATGTAVTFSGTASDVEDGNLSSKIVWTYNGAVLGTGASIGVAFGTGSFIIVASVTDSGGKQATASVTISVGSVQTSAPTIGIQSPTTGSAFLTTSAITFTGSATDTKDGTISSKIVWTSSLSGQIGTGASFTASLAAGTHTITASVTDSTGLTSSTSVSITVSVPNTPPTIAISSPANGSSYLTTSPITFTGSATETQDGNLSARIVWSSSLTGQIGTGASLSASLTAGTHTIVAQVTDSGGLSASASVTIAVTAPNTPPTVSITSPANGASYLTTTLVTLSGSASDTQDGSLSSKIAWSSSLSGALGTGANLSESLSAGTHTITAKVTDSGGLSATASVTITVSAPNTPPTVSITSPVTGSSAVSGSPIQFTGSASDTQDGNISSKLVWTSSLSGQIGTGASFSTSLVAGTHTITASVTDSGGLTTTSAITVVVTNPNTPPTLSILAPANNASVVSGTAISFSGTASDTQDGNLSSKIVWTSSLRGQIGTGASFSTSLVAGTHTITASVTDSGGLTTTSAITVVVTNPNAPPTLSILAPANNASVVSGTAISFSGTASDTQDGNLSSKIVWTSSLSGQIGTGASFSTSLAAGTHTITASITDSGGLTTTSAITVVVTNPNTPPTLSILAPVNNTSVVSGTAISFSGTASDTQDGNLSSKIVWTSSLRGQIGTGASFSTSLVAGTHTITASVTDSGGLTTTSAITVVVTNPNTPPTLSILAPANNASVVSGTAISFSGTASDTQDGNLSSKIVWTSSLSGQIGTGASFSTSLVTGTHTITASVTDLGGLTTTAAIMVTVTKPNTPPSISILAPVNGAVISQSVSVTLSGSASDVQDGNISSKIAWTSSIDGALGTGASLPVSLSPGSHTITASVTDSAGLTTKTAVSITIPTPSLAVSVATDAMSYVQRDTVNITVLVSSANGAISGATVSVVISTTSGRTLTSTATTDSTGKAVVQYQANAKRDGSGTYTVTAAASMAGYNSGSASTTFKVSR
jgi:subtilisin family serine protease